MSHKMTLCTNWNDFWPARNENEFLTCWFHIKQSFKYVSARGYLFQSPRYLNTLNNSNAYIYCQKGLTSDKQPKENEKKKLGHENGTFDTLSRHNNKKWK